MEDNFAGLIQKLETASKLPHTTPVNEEQCRVETEIIGYLVGLKVAHHDDAYVPDGIDRHPRFALQSLNQVAVKAYNALK